jgi:electron transport complex protein RnfE
MNPLKVLKNGLLDENPTFVLAIGMCPTLAVTTSAINGIGMGLSTLIVLTCSNIVISLLRNFIPDKVRIPAFIVVIASFVTIVQFLLQAYVPSLNAALGIFIPLIVVNCIILARAEAFASKNSPAMSALDGAGMGLGFTAALFVIGCIRELLGAGTLFGVTILPEFFPRTIIMILPPGAFITLGFLMAGLNAYRTRSALKSRSARANNDPAKEAE